MEHRQGISVIIPLYNKVETVRRAIDSALAQSEVDVEVIVIDDGSTDGSAELVSRYGNRIVFERQLRAGPSAARNRGVARAGNSLLGFLDADDEYVPGCLAAHVECRRLQPDTKISLISFRVLRGVEQVADEHLTDRVKGGAGTSGSVFVRHPCAAGVINVHVGGVCVNRDLFDAVGGFDPGLQCWEVSDFLYRIAVGGTRACFIGRHGLIVHSDPENSQFEKLHEAPEYTERFLLRLLAHIAELPAAERALFCGAIGDLSHSLWKVGALAAFKRAAMQASRSRGLPKGLGRGQLAILAAIPLPLLRLLWHLKASRAGRALLGKDRMGPGPGRRRRVKDPSATTSGSLRV